MEFWRDELDVGAVEEEGAEEAEDEEEVVN